MPGARAPAVAPTKIRHHKAECKNSAARKRDKLKGKTSPSDRGRVRVSSAYLQELGELKVVEAFLAVVSKVQTDELTVPVEGNVVVHRGLTENVPHIFYSTNTHSKTKKKKKLGINDQCTRLISGTTSHVK